MLVLHVRADRLEKVGKAFAMLRTDRDRVSQSQPVSVEDSNIGGPAFSLVCDDHNRRRRRAKPATNLFVERSDTLAPVEQEQGRIGIAHGGVGLLPHAPRKGMRVLVLEACGVDHSELEPEQAGVTLAPVTSYPRPIVDERKSLADEAIEQGRLADIGPADDRDG